MMEDLSSWDDWTRYWECNYYVVIQCIELLELLLEAALLPMRLAMISWMRCISSSCEVNCVSLFSRSSKVFSNVLIVCKIYIPNKMMIHLYMCLKHLTVYCACWPVGPVRGLLGRWRCGRWFPLTSCLSASLSLQTWPTHQPVRCSWCSEISKILLHTTTTHYVVNSSFITRITKWAQSILANLLQWRILFVQYLLVRKIYFSIYYCWPPFLQVWHWML